MFSGQWAALLNAPTKHSTSFFVPPTLHASKWNFPTYVFPFRSSRTFSSLPSCIQACRISLLLIHDRVYPISLQWYVILVMLAASWNNWCSSPAMMCVAAFSSCSTRLCIACLVLSKLQSLPIQLQLAQAKLVTCLASKRSQRHWVVDGLLSLRVIVLEYCGLICYRQNYIIIEAPKTDWPCNVQPQGV
jgi:hypothetical protein